MKSDSSTPAIAPNGPPVWLPTWPRLKAPIVTASVARLSAPAAEPDQAMPPVELDRTAKPADDTRRRNDGR